MKLGHQLTIMFIAGIICGGLLTSALNTYLDVTRKDTHTCKPCKCLTMKEILLHLEKREMFVDKLQRVNRRDRSAIIDSINFHNSILDSTGNAIEY